MSTRHTTLLRISRLVVTLARLFNLGMGALLIGLFLGSFVFAPAFLEIFGGKQAPRIDPGLLLPILRVTALVMLPMIVFVDLLLRRLLAMIDTVRAGDPFVPENAVRMKTIAWCMLAIQLFGLVFAAMATLLNAAGSRMEFEYSLSGWLAVLLLFVFARVFEEGTRIRGDLEAMI